MKTIIITLSAFFLSLSISSQSSFSKQGQEILKKKWKKIATRMPKEWYGSELALEIAENVLWCQKDIGGWAKNKPYHHPLSAEEKMAFAKSRSLTGATIDNGATTREMIFLAYVYSHKHDERYKQAFIRGLEYLFEAQYENGGWPQFYPLKGRDHYASHITYNDNAMFNVLLLLKEVVEDEPVVAKLKLGKRLKRKAKQAFDKGVDCILKTQIVVDGQPTVWCAQHNENTFEPANARAYELASYSGDESVNIVLLLMKIKNPSDEVVRAVEGAVKWFQEYKLTNIAVKRLTDEDGKKNKVVVQDSLAKPLWGRFYDLEIKKPFFCDRDGVKKETLAEIGYERRNGYKWYTTAPSIVLQNYPKWKDKWNYKEVE